MNNRRFVSTYVIRPGEKEKERGKRMTKSGNSFLIFMKIIALEHSTKWANVCK